MFTMLVLYRKPEDPEAFEKRYIEGHLPIVRQYKNMGDNVFLKTTRTLIGDFPYAYVFRAFWPDKDAWKEDVASDVGKQASADADEFAKDAYDVVLFDKLA